MLKCTEALGHEMRLPKKIMESLLSLLGVIKNGRDISLRDIGKILSQVALLPSEAYENNLVQAYTDLACVLIVTSVLDPELHRKLVRASAETSEIRRLMSAPPSVTVRQDENGFNQNFNYSAARWFALTVFCGGSEGIKFVQDLDERFRNIEKQFDVFGVDDRTTLAPSVQKDWIDLFRL